MSGSITPSDSMKCPRCHANWSAQATSCWLCGYIPRSTEPAGAIPEDRPQSRPAGLENASEPNPPSGRDASPDQNPFAAPLPEPMRFAPTFGLTSIFLVMTFLGILFAIFAAAPGLGIFLAIVAVPPTLRTWLVLEKRRQFGVQDGLGTRVLMFLGSALLTGVVLVVVVVAAVGTFCAICLASGNESTIPVAAVAGIGAAIPVIVAAYWLMRRRWLRDTFQSNHPSDS